MGGLAVGNAGGPEANLPIGTGHAFLYDVAQSAFLTDIVYPGSTSTTAYGIWYNGGTSYTICGGYSTIGGSGSSIDRGYLVDHDSATGQFSHWASFDYPNGPVGQDFITHVEGISGTEKGVYTLSADSVQAGTAHAAQGSWVTVRRNPDGSFGPAAWVDLNDPGVNGLASSNSVAGNQVVGIVIGSNGTSSFQATINTAFQLSNVISGNGGNGIGIYGARDNQIAMNFIGTDASGTMRRGNVKNGILVTGGAAGNVIGGQVTQTAIGTNTSIQSAMPNQGSGILISGHAHGNAIGGFQPSVEPQVTISSNGGFGIEIVGAAHDNVVFHTSIGTNAQDSAALGNGMGGILLGPGTWADTVGGTAAPLQNKILNSLGDGVRIRSSRHNAIVVNQILSNRGYGLQAVGVCTGPVVRANVIQANAKGNVNLSRSHGVVYIS